MFRKLNHFSKFQCLCLIAVVLLSACATMQPSRPVQPGDIVQVDYTCRLKDGRIVATTSDEVASDAAQEKSDLFKNVGRVYQPLVLEARETAEEIKSSDRKKTISEHIAARLVDKVVGLRLGERGSLELKADPIPGLDRNERYLRLAKAWRYMKKEIVAREEVENKLERVPEAGSIMPWRGPFNARIDEVSDNFVRFEILAPKDMVMQTPFGMGKIRDSGDRWEVAVDAREGRMVRSGGLLGRISEVGDDMFTVDFGHPFGGEVLFCDVVAQTATKDQVEAAEVAIKRDVETPDIETSNAAPQALQPTAMVPGGTPGSAAETEAAEIGDLVTVQYTATLDDGTLVQTSRREVWEDQKLKKVRDYKPNGSFGPVEIVAGENAVFPGLGEAVLDMSPGEKRTLPLVPDRAFGQSNPAKIKTFPAIKRIPLLGAVKADEYVRRFKTFPVKGNEINFTPYFKSRVKEVRENEVILEALARDGMQVPNEFGGTTLISIVGDEVVLKLVPKIGTTIVLNKQAGIISAYTDETFSVDFNHPLAGKPILLALELVSITKASEVAENEIEWIEDYDAGLSAAENRHKPAILVLYADWCGFCKKLLGETVKDIRVKALRDKFVWVKVNSDKETWLKEEYSQNGFPLTVLLDSHGNVLGKIDGFRAAETFSNELKKVLRHESAGLRLNSNG